MCPEPAALEYLLFFKRTDRLNKGVRSSYSGILVLDVKKGEELLRSVAEFGARRTSSVTTQHPSLDTASSLESSSLEMKNNPRCGANIILELRAITYFAEMGLQIIEFDRAQREIPVQAHFEAAASRPSPGSL
jgi:hypothetical protein